MDEVIEQVGDAQIIWLGGLLVGLAFGVFGQQSRFCLRSASIEFWRAAYGNKLAIWLLAFSMALIAHFACPVCGVAI